MINTNHVPGNAVSLAIYPKNTTWLHLNAMNVWGCAIANVREGGCFGVWEGFEWQKHIGNRKGKIINLKSCFSDAMNAINSCMIKCLFLVVLKVKCFVSLCVPIWFQISAVFETVAFQGSGPFCHSKQFILLFNLYICRSQCKTMKHVTCLICFFLHWQLEEAWTLELKTILFA